ncbi:hypothetical protein [Streptomyces sp. NBC_01431]|uniref:hypothetical protein n=1 Tax=Streptomyces sp. NBC_01431 TaxID=2903863 RepID=UPI002E329F05|nr:hypothetical protein [Streptomyces sp. NBC_01431]
MATSTAALWWLTAAGDQRFAVNGSQFFITLAEPHWLNGKAHHLWRGVAAL